MTNWKDFFKTEAKTSMNSGTGNITIPVSSTIPSTANMAGMSGMLTSTSPIFAGTVTAAAPSPSHTFTVGSAIGGGGGGGGGGSMYSTITSAMAGRISGGYATIPPTSVLSLSNAGKEIVKLNVDGSVTWNGEIDVDAAAEALAKSMTLGAELMSGITQRVKLEMRDSVFEDLIGIAKEKGSLTAEDLTYLLSASKIVEKLKGGK